ncbi:MAG: phosphoribosyltransferase family protein [Pseudomonadota bacterium]
MSKNNKEGIFEKCGAVLKGHFVLSSMEHSDTYLEKVYLYRNPVIFEELCLQTAREVASRTKNIEAVVGPAPIGAVLAQRVAYHLGVMQQKTIVPFFTEKDKEGQHTFRRNFVKDLAGKSVLVVDDVITTGKTIQDLVKAVVLLKGQIAAVAVICNRSEDVLNNFYMFPVISLLRMKLKTWPPPCPLCNARVPISADIGRGREFLAAHPGYPSK